MSAPRGLPAALEWLACCALPAAHRGRYHREFVAEMWWMTYPEQRRYARRLVVSVPSLRSVLRGRPRPEVVVPFATLGCALRIRHRWVTRSTDDGSRYRVCRRCGLDYGGSTSGPDDSFWASPITHM